MNRTRKSQRSSQEDGDSFWKIFLSPFLKKEKPEQYDPDFKISDKPSLLLKLDKIPLDQTTCLSGSIIEYLREQNTKTESVRKRKKRELDSELSQFVSVSQDKSHLVNRSSSSQHQEYDSGTIGKELISDKLALEEYGWTAEAAVTISDDEEEKEHKKERELDWDEYLQLKRPKLEDQISQKQSEKPVLELSDDDRDDDEEEDEQRGEEQTATLKKVTDLARDREKIGKEKPHQRVSASAWSLKTLELYIKRDDVDLVETLVSRDAASNTETFEINRFNSLQNILVKRSRQVLDDHQQFGLDREKGLRLWSFQFTNPMLTEQAVTFMVLEIIVTACDQCDVRMKPQEELEKNELFPNARVDFALAHKGINIGVVEVKTPKTMNKKALVQLLVSLLKLQSVHNEGRMQYLGILTDGFRFILVGLKGHKFTFESTTNKQQKQEINIRTVVSWDNLFEFCECLRFVLGSVTANLLEVAHNSSP